jgi:transposase
MHYLGVDVSKASLEVSDAQGRFRRTFQNSGPGLDQMIRWMRQTFGEDESRVVMEPTGTYHQLALSRLGGAGVGCVLVSPLRSRRYASYLGLRAKTDRVDAQVLARMGEREEPEPSRQPEEGRERLKALRRHREWLEEEARAVRNRLEAAGHSPWTPEEVLRSLKRIARDIERQAEAAEREIERLVKEDKELSTLSGLLTTVPGVGMKTAILILCELPRAEECKDSHTWPAFCGATPRTVQSGGTSYGILSRTGRSALRGKLYMATLSAMSCNPVVAEYTRRLGARGRTGKRAVMAAMHKLLRLCFGVLKSRRPFDPVLALSRT